MDWKSELGEMWNYIGYLVNIILLFTDYGFLQSIIVSLNKD